LDQTGGAMMKKLQEIISELRKCKIDTSKQDFLLTWERTDQEVKALTLVAECLSQLHKEGKGFRVFDSGLAIS
jgi:hypothetical protein